MEDHIEYCIINEDNLYLQNVLDGTLNNFVTYSQNYNNRQRFYTVDEARLVNNSTLVGKKIYKLTTTFEEVVE